MGNFLEGLTEEHTHTKYLLSQDPVEPIPHHLYAAIQDCYTFPNGVSFLDHLVQLDLIHN